MRSDATVPDTGPAAAKDVGLTALNGDRITPAEAKAIGSLLRLAGRWPKTLKLVSMGGALHVIHTADERFHAYGNTERGESVLATIYGIPNDGGDW